LIGFRKTLRDIVRGIWIKEDLDIFFDGESVVSWIDVVDI